ncbi:class I SAM-dependent methyltransferase [Paenibacillus vini]|uniref:class I SAM-dependent methyltransferase n=1 Tax=Paenibacillus vini TaxID=1476024 RepID=UPI0025B71F44|nr:class I SAM-dependent methyltransferase [Paenibacillus vini]MDN4066455.1 class I SAM-dependent methyltransferase [Paenibacillus vini]
MKCCSCKSEKLIFYKKYAYWDNSVLKEKFTDLGIYQCQTCDLIQVNHSEIDSEILDCYYVESYRGSGFNVYSPEMEGWFLARAAALTNEVKRHFTVQNKAPNSLKVFEFGAGYGYNLLEIRSLFPNAELSTNELDLHCVETLRANNIQVTSIKDHFNDIFVLSHVLEHFVNPLSIIDEICKQLNTNGLIIIEVPNDHFLDLKITNEPHLSFFNKRSLSHLFKENYKDRLEVLDVYTSGPEGKEYFSGPQGISYFLSKEPPAPVDFSNRWNGDEGICLRIILRKL